MSIRCPHGMPVVPTVACIICDTEVAMGIREPINWAVDTNLRLEGYVIAHEILKHRCWCRWIPFAYCQEQRKRGDRLEQISAQLWEVADG